MDPSLPLAAVVVAVVQLAEWVAALPAVVALRRAASAVPGPVAQAGRAARRASAPTEALAVALPELAALVVAAPVDLLVAVRTVAVSAEGEGLAALARPATTRVATRILR